MLIKNNRSTHGSEFSIEYNKVFYEREFNKSLLSFYSGFGSELEYISIKVHSFAEQVGVESYISIEDGIDYYGDFWNSDSIIIVEDDFSTINNFEVYFNIPFGIKLENDIPLIKTQIIFLELDLILLNLIFYFSSFKTNGNNLKYYF